MFCHDKRPGPKLYNMTNSSIVYTDRFDRSHSQPGWGKKAVRTSKINKIIELQSHSKELRSLSLNIKHKVTDTYICLG